MPRKARQLIEKGIYHVILRGNNQQNLFHDDQDRYYFISRMEKYSKEVGINIYAYCLMSNHVHILLGKTDKEMSLLIQKLANSYVFYFNRKYDRSGHLFQGRYKSEIVDNEEYFKVVYAYILKNSEKAGLGDFKQYRWNSFDKKNQNFIDYHYVIDVFGSEKSMMFFLSFLPEVDGMEYENKKVFSDERAFIFIKELFGIETPYRLERLRIDEQKSKCKILRQKGLSISQIARVTGISKSIIRAA